jgi:Tannase and feruloyl esterase
MKVCQFLSAIAGALLCGAVASPVRAAPPSENCDTETVKAMAPADTTVAFAAREAGGCRVVGYVTTRHPGPNKVLFTLGLPDRFNGRYLYLGVGGAAGSLPNLRMPLLAKGYALAGSDGGTGAKNGADFSFKKDPAKNADFLGRGVHVTAVATQQITKAYYKEPFRRYIAGCSGGGQMSLGNALRFGAQDFDGFVVGATPWGPSAYMPNVYRIAQYLQTHPEGWISPELMAKADAAILSAYDGTDGAVDGIIADQRNIKSFDVGILHKVGFTPAQIATFDLIRKPQKYSVPGLGDRVQPGYPITNVGSWSGFLLGTGAPPWPDTSTLSASDILAKGAPFIHVMADTNTRAAFPGRSYVKAKDLNELSELAAKAQGIGETPPIEEGFAKLGLSGAKMIVYHGVNDQAMSYLETLQSYETLAAKQHDVAKWLRVFTIPGLMHCAGGPGPTNVEDPFVDALTSWVEQGQAPDTVMVERTTPAKGVERTFRLCAEPMRAALRKPGLDFKKAENWECRAPAT